MISTVVKRASEPRRAGALRARGTPVARSGASGGGEARPAPASPRAAMVVHKGGEVCHARCGQPLEFHGRRAGLELDFFCRRCMEHVTLPECLVPGIPVVEEPARPAAGAFAAPGGAGWGAATR